MDITLLKERKEELGYTNAQIAQLSGVPLGTVSKVFAGITASPRVKTIEAIAAALDMPVIPSADHSLVEETAFQYGAPESRHAKKQGAYTLEDYYKMPEDWRGELIDGVFYDMTAPATSHQMVLLAVWRDLDDYAEKHGGPCLPLAAPVDVRLDCDDRTVVEPDVLVLCDPDKLQERGVLGAPDFVAEVLSPSTRKTDLTLKLQKYMAAGVREYWIIDPEQERVMVYAEDSDVYVSIYSFRDKVPVRIWDGALEVDFTKIKAKLDRYCR